MNRTATALLAGTALVATFSAAPAATPALSVDPSRAHHLSPPVSFPKRDRLARATLYAPAVPVRASAFLGSIGVNTHLGWGGPWTEARVASEMAFLNVFNLRDGALKGRDDVVTELAALAKQGVRFDIEQTVDAGTVDTNDDMIEMAKLEQQATGSIAFYEAANEYNTNSYKLGTATSNGNLAWGALDDQASQTALRGTAALAGIPLIAASTASVSSAPSVAGFADRSNWHVYGPIGGQLAQNLAGAIAAAQATLPGKPVMITETGISSASVAGQSWGTAGDEYTQGLIDTNALLDAFKDGAALTYLYNLMDNQQAADLEDNFGLFNADGTAKAAATDIHNLTTILADAGATAGTFAPTVPGFVVPALPAGASSLLLQKSSGVWDLVLWNSSLPVWAGTGEAPLNQADFTMPLGGTYASVKIYNSILSTTPEQTFTNVSSLSLSLGKEMQIIEIAGLVPPTPAPAPVVTPPSSSCGTATDTLKLAISEDAYQGDAQYTVSVDGKQVGGTYTATASHAAGASQSLVLTGTWGTGAHTVAVTFLNDLYAGTAATDRNLYVGRVTYDGVPAAQGAMALMSNGAVSWAVGG